MTEPVVTCVRCKKAPKDPDSKSSCRPCLDAQKARTKALRDERKSAGRCIDCGRRKSHGRKGPRCRVCQRHVTSNIEAARAGSTGPGFITGVPRIPALRKAAGVCRDCSRVADEDSVYCRKHRRERNFRRSREMAETYAQWKAEGRCMDCGAENPGGFRCQKHREMNNERRKRRMAKEAA